MATIKQIYVNHGTAIIDEGCAIGEGTKIWHFSHIMPNCTIGKNCNTGQNVVASPEVVLRKCKGTKQRIYLFGSHM